jgi:hypothetical protein
MAGPSVVAAKAPQIAAGLNQMQANAMAPRTLNPQTGAIVWHGSPHKFDKFDSSKIGTGEGAQAYGHGLYLAESPDVAGSYKTALTGSPLRFQSGGKTYAPGESKAADFVLQISGKGTGRLPANKALKEAFSSADLNFAK